MQARRGLCSCAVLLYTLTNFGLFIIDQCILGILPFHRTGDYALSKDVDVALWLDYNKKEPVMVANDFVIVNSDLHDDFDAFKAEHIKSNYSYVPLNE